MSKDTDNMSAPAGVFLLNDIPSKTGLAGYMPLKNQFAFIYKGKTDVRTIAHEIGHGAFRLWHPFSAKSTYYMAEGSSDNLMDYNNGERLHKYQWDFVQNPESGIYFFQDEEEGAFGKLRFKRAPETGIYYTKYGYDDMDNNSTHHISVGVNSETYIEVKGIKNFKNIQTRIDSVIGTNIATIDTINDAEGLFLRIAGNNVGKGLLVVANPDREISINLDVYTLTNIDCKILSAQLPSDNRAPGDRLNFNDISIYVKGILKYGVINVVNKVTLNVVPLNYDLNGDGKLNIFINAFDLNLDYERNALYNINGGRNSGNTILINKEIEKALGFNIDYIQRPTNDTLIIDRGPGNEFVVGSYYKIIDPQDRRNNERFKINSMIWVALSDGRYVRAIKMDRVLNKNHPSTFGGIKGHYLLKDSNDNNEIKGIQSVLDDVVPSNNHAAIANATYITSNNMAKTISHEILHGYGLGHVNIEANIMYFKLNTYDRNGNLVSTTPDQYKPIRFMVLRECETSNNSNGDATCNECGSSACDVNQWDIIEFNK